MTDLASELAILEEHYTQVESDLADRKAAQQAELQTMADEFNAENVAAAREMVLTEGKIDYVKSKLRQATNGHEQADDLSLLQRVHARQNAPALADSWSGLSVPDNDPD